MQITNLLKVIKNGGISDAFATLPWIASLAKTLVAGSEKEVAASPFHSTWEEEREDILERANWLYKKVVVPPEQLTEEAPAIIGEEYQGEWAIYSCSMFAHALANISVIYPETKEKCPEIIAKLIDIVNTPAIRQYDTVQWKEDALQSLSGNKSHMTYLSILSWMITNYKFVGGDNRYNTLLDQCCEALNRRMLMSKYDMNLLSFPNKQIWLPDMFVSIVALHNYGRLYNGKYADTLEKWMQNARTKWIHRSTGLLAGTLPGQSRYQRGISMSGACTALNCSYLSLVDEVFAKDQHEKMKKAFLHQTTVHNLEVTGIKEYLRKLPKLQPSFGTAGFIFHGLSAGGTAFALGSATFHEDWELRYQLLRTAEIGGCTIKEEGMRHYRLGEVALAGEAIALAMRTQIRR